MQCLYHYGLSMYCYVILKSIHSVALSHWKSILFDVFTKYVFLTSGILGLWYDVGGYLRQSKHLDM